MFAPPQISIRKAVADDVDALVEMKMADIEECFARQDSGSLDIYIATQRAKPVGYSLINWSPKYKFYDVMNIPAIQDLRVKRSFRRKGIATAMMKMLENIVSAAGYQRIGISVGVTAKYGAAQRIYAKMGYIPDGHGVTYDRESIKSGEFRPIDDNLCLMMVKELA